MGTSAIVGLALLLGAAPGLRGAPSARPGVQQEGVEEESGMSGQVEFGFVSASGNTEARTWNLNGELGYASEVWSHEGSLRYLRSSDEEGTIADRTLLRAESRRAFGDRNFAFASVRYERDRFSGFDYRVTERFGYGRQLFLGEPVAWEVEVGAGSRQSRRMEDGVSTTEFIGSVATALTWTLSDAARLTEEVSVDTGSEGTVSQSITAVTADLVSSLALRLAFDAKHTSEVPVDREKLDTITSATLVFQF